VMGGAVREELSVVMAEWGCHAPGVWGGGAQKGVPRLGGLDALASSGGGGTDGEVTGGRAERREAESSNAGANAGGEGGGGRVTGSNNTYIYKGCVHYEGHRCSASRMLPYADTC
jgi:hypothetical protein